MGGEGLGQVETFQGWQTCHWVRVLGNIWYPIQRKAKKLKRARKEQNDEKIMMHWNDGKELKTKQTGIHCSVEPETR